MKYVCAYFNDLSNRIDYFVQVKRVIRGHILVTEHVWKVIKKFARSFLRNLLVIESFINL